MLDPSLQQRRLGFTDPLRSWLEHQLSASPVAYLKPGRHFLDQNDLRVDQR